MPRPPRRQLRETPGHRWGDESPHPYEEGPPDEDETGDGPVVIPITPPERRKPKTTPTQPPPKRPA